MAEREEKKAKPEEMENEIVYTSIAKLWEGKDGIGRVVILPNAVITLDGAKEIITAATKLSKGRSTPVLFDLRNVKSTDRQARKYFASEEASKITKAAAVLVSSPVSRVIGNFFMGLNMLPYPIKIFTSEDEAIKWLKRFLE